MVRRECSDYPISRLLQRELEGARIGEFVVERLGYRNVAKGIRSVERWLKEGEGSEFVLAGLAKRCGREEIERALAETRARKLEERRLALEELDRQEEREFVPYVFIETERCVPSQIFFAGITGGRSKWFPLKRGLGEEPRSLRLVGKAVRLHFRKMKGFCPFWGPVLGYRYVPNLERSVLLDIRGEVEREEVGRFRGRPREGNFGVRVR